MFNINFQKIVYNLIPFFLRKEKNLDYIYSLIKPLKDVNVLFFAIVNKINYKLTYTSESNVLARFLNNEYSTTGISITNNNATDYLFIFNKSESKPKTYIFNKSEGEPKTYVFTKDEHLNRPSFTVNVPISVTFVEAELRSKINTYNQVGKIYTITTY